jgi:hypothetical protein
MSRTPASEQAPSLAEAARAGADAARRELLTRLHALHGDNLSAIARAARATRLQVRTYMRRYKIGSYAPLEERLLEADRAHVRRHGEPEW